MSDFNVTVQHTNNENIVKFVTNSFLTQAKSYEFINIDDAKPSPIAQQLFFFPFVKTVYISQNFIAVEKFLFKTSKVFFGNRFIHFIALFEYIIAVYKQSNQRATSLVWYQLSNFIFTRASILFLCSKL